MDNDSLYDKDDLLRHEDEVSPTSVSDDSGADIAGIRKKEENVSPVNIGGGFYTGTGKTGKSVADMGAQVGGKAGALGKGGAIAEGAIAKGGKGIGGKGIGGKKQVVALALLLAIAVIGIAVIGAIGNPMTLISFIDYGFQGSLGFDETTAILEEQGEYVLAEQQANGRVPDEYAGKLAENGILIGQVTASGDFVRTNTYIANIEELDEVAVVGSGYHAVGSGDGELAVLFNNEVITADNFVMAVESNPEMYAAYSKATDISARYYYSEEVNDVYKSLGLSRGSFNSWQQTGDYEKDQESFNEILVKVLDDSSETEANGYRLRDSVTCTYVDENGVSHTVTEHYVYDFKIKTSGETVTEDIDVIEEESDLEYCSVQEHFNREGASGMTDALTHASKGADEEHANKSAATLLNTAISANEPIMGAKAFLAIEEPIQRARIDGDGPVNEIMNTISEATEIRYTDVATGNEVVENKSILDTRNFGAAVSNSDYSREEAMNFSRDRAMYLAGAGGDTGITKATTVSLDSKIDPDGITRTMTGKSDAPSGSVLGKTTNSVDVAITKKNSETFTSMVGGNRVVEGGSYLSNTIDQRVIGSMPSDAETIAKYHNEVETVLARRAEAERATLSPFDTSSPNTFLGSLVRKVAIGMISGRSSGSSARSAVGTVANLTGDSVASLINSVSAEGEGDTFTTMLGECTTVKTANVEGNLFCSSHNTVNTAHMDWTEEQWRSEINSVVGEPQFEDDGSIKPNSELAQFIIMGMDREATVGVESAEVCNTYHDMNDNIIQKLIHVGLDIFGLYKVCQGVDGDVANGAAYALHNSDDVVALFSGYVLYMETKSLLDSAETNEVTAFKDKYYTEHPKDNSEAGIIARRSGMTKYEAEVALAYADYLTFLANYDTSDLYVFGQNPKVEGGDFDFIEFSDEWSEMMALVVARRDSLDVRRDAVFSV